MLPSSPIDLKCLDFTRCMANLLVEIITAYLPCGQQWQFVVSIEFYLSSQLFADHYTGSASPRLPLELRQPCAVCLLVHLFMLFKSQHRCCSFGMLTNWFKVVAEGQNEREREMERASSTFSASLLHFCAGKLYHTPTLCCHHIKC